MNNWERQERSLTQGQPPGSLVVARAVHIDEITTSITAPPAGSGGAAPADAHAVAQRVFELLREELRVEFDRRRLRR